MCVYTKAKVWKELAVMGAVPSRSLKIPHNEAAHGASVFQRNPWIFGFELLRCGVFSETTKSYTCLFFYGIFPIPNPPNPFNHVSVEHTETFTQTHRPTHKHTRPIVARSCNMTSCRTKFLVLPHVQNSHLLREMYYVKWYSSPLTEKKSLGSKAQQATQ